MSFYQDRMTDLLNELRKSFNDNFDMEQINKLAESLQKFSSVMQQVAADISTHFFTEEMM